MVNSNNMPIIISVKAEQNTGDVTVTTCNGDKHYLGLHQTHRITVYKNGELRLAPEYRR